MKLSKKEKVLICVVGIGLLGYAYYDVVYSRQMAAIEQKTQEKNEIESRYNQAIASINTMQSKADSKVLLSTKVNNIASSFYPTISQEHIILELNKLLNDSGLTGTYNFEDVEVKEVEMIEKKQVEVKESSLQSLSDKYHNAGKGIVSNSESNSANNESTTKTNNSNAVAPIGEQIEQLQCELTFRGEYSALNYFLNSLKNYEKKIVVNNLALSQKSMTEVNGTMRIEFYAIPKLDNELDEYLKWELNNIYGKQVPFSTDAASGNVEAKQEVKSDFIISVKPETSVLPTVIMGKSNDSVRTSYVYANKNDEEKVELILTKEGDKYYYKYKTSTECYPENYNAAAVEFIPVSENIIVDIATEARGNASDRAGINLTIINDTGKLVDVNVTGDDRSDPRVKIDGDGSTIRVNKK